MKLDVEMTINEVRNRSGVPDPRECRGFRNDHAKTSVETRSDGNLLLSGYAAVFYRSGQPGTEFELWPGSVERVMPGAFSDSLAKDDPVGLLDHDTLNVLGRRSAGTLRLREDEIGLHYEIDLDPEDPFDRRIAKRVQRGDLNGSSFGFIDQQRSWDRSGHIEIRSLVKTELLDVGPVTYQAYAATTTDVAQRSADAWRKEIEASAERVRRNRARRIQLAGLRQRNVQ